MDELVPPRFRLPWRQTDGGRARAGFPPGQADCAVRAAVLVTGLPYLVVYAALAGPDPIKPEGIEQDLSGAFLTEHGFAFTRSSGLVRLRSDELPEHPLMIVCLQRHMTVVSDGVIFDVADPVNQCPVWVIGWWAPTSG